MNRPSLYAAFGDKRDLYLKTLEYYRNESRVLAREALADHPPLRVFLKRFYSKALELYLEGGPRGCYSIGTAATVAAVDDGVRAFLAESMRTTDSFLKHQIETRRRWLTSQARRCTRSRSDRAPDCRARNWIRWSKRQSALLPASIDARAQRVTRRTE
jgi:AcrR family transcriptional regulator